MCFVTKAVHLEAVTSLTTDAFLATLRRCGARRGKPNHLYSDNVTNFVGTAPHLQELYALLQSSDHSQRIQDLLACENCQCHFIPPHAPHFGGLWKAALKSMLEECGPTFYDSQASLNNAANMAGCKQNTKMMVMVNIKK
jgi:hypothetical protein